MEHEQEWEDMNMTTEYFERTKYYREKYGANTIVLMQCGTFYEMYGHKTTAETEYKGSLIHEFSQKCNMTISAKKIKTSANNKGENQETIYMAGFRDYSLEKYVKKLVDHEYTVVVISQREENKQKQQSGAKKMERYVEGIYSPGTHMSYETETDQQWNKHLMCIWIQPFKNTHYIIGCSILNIFTGQSHLLEHQIQSKLQSTSFDELEKCIAIYRPKEVLFICDDDKMLARIYGLQNVFVHSYNSDMVAVNNAEKQVYRRHMLNKYFGEEAIYQCSEFSQCELATQSFCFLLNFLEEHNKELCRRVKLPQVENNHGGKLVLLANHTLHQLNIIDDVKLKTHHHHHPHILSSVHSWTNKCITTMGKRLFLHTLTHPTYDEIALEREYAIMGQWLHTQKNENPKKDQIETIRKQLQHVHDIQTLSRQLMLRRIYPSGLCKIYKSVQMIQQILIRFEEEEERDKEGKEMSWMYDYLSIDWPEFHQKLLQFLHFIDTRIHVEVCASITSSINNIEEPLLKQGIYENLDTIYNQYNTHQTQLDEIRFFWDRKMSPTAKMGDFVKHCHTEKHHAITLQMTKTRCKTLQDKMKGHQDKIVLPSGVEFYWKDVSFSNSTKANNEIHFPQCDEICRYLGQFQTDVNALTQEIFVRIMEEVEVEHMDFLETCGTVVSILDVLLNKCHIAQKYHYTAPIIDKTASKSFVHAYGLRHILIEQINTDEIYVTNDVILGYNKETEANKEKETEKETEIDGMLMFGTNTGGKTSLMRALGTAIILAQAGMYVPCKSFLYKPYKSIYSRILNQDNFFKGQSTFSVEMSELRVILQYADENSLVLGDELCSGTETVSALSIMMASLIRLHDRRSSFLFATHFHEIVDFEELEQLERLKCFHVGLTYDPTTESLIYDRKLKPGSGTRSYGLEVCESLYMDKAFLEQAYNLRKKHFPEHEGSLAHEKTKYNAKKIKGECEQCGKPSVEIHHLQEQHKANKTNGFIDGFHKNHPANLMSLCEECHLHMHHPHNNNNNEDSTVISNLTMTTVTKRVKIKRVRNY
jgi:DNA mismatch repair protein MutS